MAKILGGHRNAAMAQERCTSSSGVKKLDKSARTVTTKQARFAANATPFEMKDETAMEDSLELDMYDDKRNRIIKRSNRRKFNFESKIGC